VCETDATEVSETADLDCKLTELIASEGFVTYSCRQIFVNKIDIKVLFGGGSEWATGWTVRARIPCKRLFSKTSKPALEPTQRPVRRVPVLFLGWKTAGLGANSWHPSSTEVREERTCNSTACMCLRSKLFVAGPLVRRPGLSAKIVRLGFYGEYSGTVTGFPPSTSIFSPHLEYSINAAYSLI
jgi:hypothetical protein